MPILHRDIETRSTLNLTTVGAWRYAADGSTEVLCVAYAVDDDPAAIWVPGEAIPKPFIAAAANPDWLVAAHNDQFEAAIEERLLNPRFGWSIIPIDRHRCSMAMALANALPASLGGAAEALGLALQKDAEGHRLMMQMAKPRRARKGENPNAIYWHDDPERHARLRDYCRRDVEVERELLRRLRPLSNDEQLLWQLDALINKRGFRIDFELAVAAQNIVREEQAAIDGEIAALTGGKVTSINQVGKIQALLRERGHGITCLTKRSVSAVLAQEPTGDVRRLLELRREGAQAAARKLHSLLAGIDEDQRLRGTLRFHGASTGRWAGARFQPQNLKKPQTKDLDGAINAVRSSDLQRVRAFGAPWQSPATSHAL
jgi:DNA polymerase bacteriophage-type